jgi:hypothetical protein
MPGPVYRWCADGVTFRFIFMDVFSGPLGREGKSTTFLRNVLKVSHKDTRRHFPENLNPLTH